VENTVREVKIQYVRKLKRIKISGPKDAEPLILKAMPDNSREHFVALYLDSAHDVIGWRVVSTGSVNSTQVHPREIYQPALMIGAVAVIVAHNHPSGEQSASRDDIAVTHKLVDAGKIIGIRLLDHLLLGDGPAVSFRDRGIITE
jgi:DNA repair protein RadC